MLVSVAVGIALQVLVTEVPYFIELFGTIQLSLGEWGGLLFMALMPLVLPMKSSCCFQNFRKAIPISRRPHIARHLPSERWNTAGAPERCRR